MKMLTRREWHRLMAAGVLTGAAGRPPRARGGQAAAGGGSRIPRVLFGWR